MEAQEIDLPSPFANEIKILNQQILNKNEIIHKMQDEIDLKDEKIKEMQMQSKKIFEREMESRARANASEGLVEKFFDKMLERMN